MRRRILAVLGAVSAAAITTSGVATADGAVQIKSRVGDVCLDAPSDMWPTHVMVNPCNGADFQRWNLTGDQRLESAAFPGRCLNRARDIEPLRLVACWNSQHWSLQPDGHITAALGGCLTLLGSPDPGTAVGSRTCGGGPEQGWDAVP